jgi:periplasmic divalent cation tolerance protein
MTDKLLVLSTAGSEAEAARIAEQLVKRRLAACVNVLGPMRSFYRWKDNLERAEECLMIIKTVQEQIDKLEAAIRELHSYELPEFITVRVDGGSEQYLNWIGGSVG